MSVSTLRRRIKRQEIEYSFDDGRYFIEDRPLIQLLKEKAPPQTSPSAPRSKGPDPRPKVQDQTRKIEVGVQKVSEPSPDIPAPLVPPSPSSFAPHPEVGHQVLAETTQNLLAEIKKAYSIILQEKEEQVIQLKDEVADLRTLVRVLEEENERLKALSEDSHSLDEWLKSI